MSKPPAGSKSSTLACRSTLRPVLSRFSRLASPRLAPPGFFDAALQALPLDPCRLADRHLAKPRLLASFTQHFSTSAPSAASLVLLLRAKLGDQRQSHGFCIKRVDRVTDSLCWVLCCSSLPTELSSRPSLSPPFGNFISSSLERSSIPRWPSFLPLKRQIARPLFGFRHLTEPYATRPPHTGKPYHTSRTAF